jgi:hypothetical protein
MDISIKDKKVDINITDKKLIKDVISGARKSGTSGGVRKSLKKGVDSLKAAGNVRPIVRDMVEDFCENGVTITISYKGDRTVTVGREANSKLTRLVTGTKGIQIDSPLKLAEMTL